MSSIRRSLGGRWILTAIAWSLAALDRLSEDLRLVADQTMRPTQAVVWLRERRA